MIKLKLSVLTVSQRLVTPRTPRLSGRLTPTVRDTHP
eukprot:COSAG06_NODE_43069_length_375_cov_1.188406_1_plen_36_part_01